MTLPENREPVTQFIRIGNVDEAFRAALFLLAADPFYARQSLLLIHSLYASIRRDHYLLAVKNGKICGLLTWGEISAQTRDECVELEREPITAEILASGDAIFCSSFVTTSPSLLRVMWEHFVCLHADKDILFIRHQKNGKLSSKFGLLRDGKLVRQAK